MPLVPVPDQDSDLTDGKLIDVLEVEQQTYSN
jgi:hypothetical protein